MPVPPCFADRREAGHYLGRRLAELNTDGVPYDVAIGEGDTVWVVTASGQVAQYHAVEF